MRDIQVSGVLEASEIEALVARKRKPGREVGSVEPGVAQDADPLGLNEQPCMAQEGDVHKSRPGCLSHAHGVLPRSRRLGPAGAVPAPLNSEPIVRASTAGARYTPV